MASCSFPTKCTSCSKEVQEEAAAFAIWKCRQDHHHVCCTVECQRVLERRSEKVVDALNKMEHKVSNEGRMNALRRLPPQEREKLKQRDQAQQHDGWLCPFDLKVADKCVPHCAHCMSRVGGKATQGEDEVAPPPPPRPGDEGGQRAASSTAPPPPSELITDDALLVPLNREEDDEDEVPNKKKGKPKKPKTPKPTIPIVPEKYMPDPFVEAEADAKAGAYVRRTPASDKTSKINEVVLLTGCSPDLAMDLLEGSYWVVDKAVEFHLASGDSQPKPAGNGRCEVAWGAQRSQVAEPDTGSSPAEPRPGIDPPAPPVGMAPGWQAVFSQEHQQFYFWHTGTGKTTWTLPVYTEEQQAAEDAQRRLVEQERLEQARRVEEERRRAAEEAARLAAEAEELRRAAEARERERALAEEQRRKEEARREEARRAEERRRAEEAQRLASLNKIRDVTGLPEERCRAILEEAGWVHEDALHRAIAEQNWLEAERKRREEQARELAERQRQEREKQERERQEAERQRQLLEEERQRLLERERELQRQLALQATEGSLGPDGPPWVRLCTRHFTPKSSAQGAIPLLHGQRLEVTWVDTQPDPEDSWAYGRLVDEPSKAGYFPKAVLREVWHQPRHRARGQECRIVERFSAPEDIGGYLSVEVGEMVQIFEMGTANVWAYVWRGADAKGWVPECVLRDA